MSKAGEAFAVLGFVVVALVIILLPAIIAFRRHHPNRWLILAVTLVFGATLLGWLVAMVWALNVAHAPKEGSEGGEGGLNLFVNDPQRGEIVAPQGSSMPLDIAGELERLVSLRDNGSLTEEEFGALKARVLGRI